MRITHSLLLLLILINISSCQRDHKNVFEKNKIEKSNKPVSWKRRLAVAVKDRTIFDVVELSRDTIILLRRSIGIEISVNRGKNWKWLNNIYQVNEITIDDKGVLWALLRWKGIHEPGYSVLYQSSDFGKTWKSCTFNISVFFPYHIYSKPHQPLQIDTYWDHKIYQLAGNDPSHHWVFIKKLPINDNDVPDKSAGNYFIDSHTNDDNKLYVKRAKGAIDTLMHFRKAYNIYYIENIKDTIYVAGPSGTDSAYIGTIVNEHLIKECTVGGYDLSLKKTTVNHIWIYKSDGAYLKSGDKFIQLYK